MPAFDALLTITLDEETLRYSILGTSSGSYCYEARLDSIGDVSRQVAVNGGISPMQSLSVVIDDPDGTLRKKAGNTTFRRRVVQLDLIDLDTGRLATVFKGRISKRRAVYDKFNVTAYDDAFDRLKSEISLTTNTGTFTYLPVETPVALIPIPLGTIDSSSYGARGHIPAYLVDPAQGQTKYRYVLAQIAMKSVTAVFNDDVLVDPNDYTVTYDLATTPLGSIRMTFLDFTYDPRDIQRQSKITADGTGLTDDGLETGTLVTNPAEAIKTLLDLRQVVSASEFGSIYTTTETAYTTAGMTIRYVATKLGMTWMDLIDDVSQSLNMQLFLDKDGSFALGFDDAQSPASTLGILKLSDSANILERSFSVDEVNPRSISTADVSYAYDFARNVYDSETPYTYTAEETSLGTSVRGRYELKAAASIARAKKMAQIKLFQGSSERIGLRLQTTPDLDLDLMDRVQVTHYSGTSQDGSGFVEKTFRVYGISLVHDGDGLKYELDLVDNPGLTLDSPSDTEPTRQDIDPPPDADRITADAVWTLTDYDTVTWAAFTFKVWKDGVSTDYSIGGSNSGNLGAGLYYIYFDPDASITALQTPTTVYADAIGPKKWILATARRNSSTALKINLHVYVGVVSVDGTTVPTSVSGDQIPDGEIVADHISATAIDGKTITGATIQTASSGARIVMTSSAFTTYDSSSNALVTLPTTGTYAGQIVLSQSNTVPGRIVFENVGTMGCKVTSDTLDIFPISSGNGQVQIGAVGNLWTWFTSNCRQITLISTPVTGSVVGIDLGTSEIDMTVAGGTELLITSTGVDIPGTLTVDTIDDSGAGTVTFNTNVAAAEFHSTSATAYIRDSTPSTVATFQNVSETYGTASTITLGDGSAKRGALWLRNDGSGTSQPGLILAEAANGLDCYVWFDNDGVFRIGNAKPQNDPTIGYGGWDTAGNLWWDNVSYLPPSGRPGTSGDQLSCTTAGAMSWTAASSLRDKKNILRTRTDEAEVLKALIGLNVYDFMYKRELRIEDPDNVYTGVMADEAPFLMHHNNSIVSLVSSVGYMIMGMKAMARRIEYLEEELSRWRNK